MLIQLPLHRSINCIFTEFLKSWLLKVWWHIVNSHAFSDRGNPSGLVSPLDVADVDLQERMPWNVGARWWGKQGLGIWGAEGSTCSWQCVFPGICSCLAASVGDTDRVPHCRPSELCFAPSKEDHKRKAETQPSSCLSAVINVLFWFGWKRVWGRFFFVHEALLIPLRFSTCTSYSRHVREHGTFFF